MVAAEMLLIDLVLMDWMSVDRSVNCVELRAPTWAVLRPPMAEVEIAESWPAPSRAAIAAVLNWAAPNTPTWAVEMLPAVARAATCAPLRACTWAVFNSPTVAELRSPMVAAEILLIDLVLMD